MYLFTYQYRVYERRLVSGSVCTRMNMSILSALTMINFTKRSVLVMSSGNIVAGLLPLFCLAFQNEYIYVGIMHATVF